MMKKIILTHNKQLLLESKEIYKNTVLHGTQQSNAVYQGSRTIFVRGPHTRVN